MLPLLSFHALAAQRGDGLKPELLALLARHAGLGAVIVAANIEPADEAPQQDPAHDPRPDHRDAG
ncbi:hypothetical protein [Caballeronia sp. J97]|uniref:hypothetical protein n=1 Tax=Caballeronia sp. J97 TaxID=2805429 RepID=UPI002AB2AC7E|nr:hypothetical protein [Caballeronia sp. J97]